MFAFVFRWKPFLVSLLVTLGAGGVSALLTMNSMDVYSNLNQPPLAPPGFLFPIVWTILYLLMAISAYLIFGSHSPFRKRALILYAVQLGFNVLWPVAFFVLQWFWFALVWLVVLITLILAMIVCFYRIDRVAAWLQIPYLLWCCFAAYLNLMTALLN